MFRQADVQLLRRTHSSALALAQKVAATTTPTISEQLASVTATDLVLPDPQPLTRQLLELGVDQSSATHISAVFLRFANLLKQSSEADFRRRQCVLRDRVPPSLSSVYAAIYSRAIKDWTVYLLKDITPRVIRVRREHENRSQSPASLQRNKRPFNQAAIPILERFFDQNAFPSRLEKHELAGASNMDYRQVHVWFQNRRSRSRKEGKSLNRRGSMPCPLAALENSVVDALLPAEKEEGLDQEELNCTQITFNAEAPAHAFPSPYPPVCPYDPFPIAQEHRSFPTPWIRRPSTRPQPPPSVDDMITLTVLLSKLSIGAECATEAKVSQRCLEPGSCPERQPRMPPILGFVTPLPLAPIPALLTRCKKPSRHSRPSSCSSASTSSPRQSPFPQSRCFISSRTEPPASFGFTGSLRREIKRTLPRRVPKYPPRGNTPYDSPPSPRRASSFASLASSTSQSESDSESPLPTPPLYPTTNSEPVPFLALDASKGTNPLDEYLDARSIDSLFGLDPPSHSL